MSWQYRYKNFIRILAGSALIGICNGVAAAGFQIQEQNVTNLGLAYAGTAALAEDASTNFYNSAGLTRLCNEQLVLSGVLFIPYARVDATRATTTFPNPFTGSNANVAPGSAKARGTVVVPAFHYSNRIDCDWVFGLSIAAPFGLKTSYKPDEVTRYFATKAELHTYDIAPSIAYCLGNGFSFGIGPDFLYADADLNTQVGITGAIASDGYQRNNLARWGYGGHVGIMYDLCENSRVGINYRSEVKIKGRGLSNARTPGLPAAAVLVGPETTQNVRSDFTLPDTAVLSLYHQLDDCWGIAADVQWTHWTKIQNLTLRFDNNQTVTYNLNFRNAWRFALGTTYQYDCNWLFRLGAAYDQSPVRGADFRTAAIPDSDRVWLSIGGRYRFDKCFALEFGYAHLFFKNSSINESAPVGTGFTTRPSQVLQGRYRVHADLLGIQLTWDLL